MQPSMKLDPMPPARGFYRRWLRLSSRLRIFLVAAILAAICGAIEGGEPLEDLIKGARDVVRARDASGEIVVVGIDERTGNALSGFTFSRRYDAKVVDELFRLGARRVFFDKTYAYPTNAGDDAQFTASLARHRGKVFLGAASPVDPTSWKPVVILPFKRFRAVSSFASLNGMQTPFAFSAKLTTSDTFDGKMVPSLSYALSGLSPKVSAYYRPDWSIRTSSVPTVSFADVVNGSARRSAIAGRDVVIGPTAAALGDIRNLVFQGFMPGVYLHVIGAETLKRGIPVNLGWMPAFIFALLVGALVCRARPSQPIWGYIFGAVIAFTAMPIVLDELLITIDIVPGLIAFNMIIMRVAMARRVERSHQTNIASGLPNANALVSARSVSRQTLVALKIRNQAEIRASFNVDVEGRLIGELCRRIRLSQDVTTIYHSQDVLLWLTEQPMARELADHLEGLHQISMASLVVGDREVDVSMSFGVDADWQRPMESRLGSAIQCAEEAARSNDIWKFFDPDRLHEAAWSLSLMSRLDHAIDTGEIFVLFQPKMDLQSGKVIGAEALVRWQHPSRGLIGPDAFVPAAEEHKRIQRLTCFVLDRAIATAAQVCARGHDFGIAVNVSTQLVQTVELTLAVQSALAVHGLHPARLTLEITETGTLDKAMCKSSQLSVLEKIGIKTSIDDFGTGHASLERLRTLRADEIKIDKQFVSDIDTTTDKQAIVRATVAIANDMGMRVVAEGIETQAELDMVASLGVPIGQGFLMSPPIDSTTLIKLLDPPLRRVA